MTTYPFILFVSFFLTFHHSFAGGPQAGSSAVGPSILLQPVQLTGQAAQLAGMSSAPPHCSVPGSPVAAAHRPVYIAPTVVGAKQDSDKALLDILQAIQTELKDGRCIPEKTVFVFDVDETVLVVKADVGQAIRSSPAVIAQMQALGISTVALTIRDVVAPGDRRRIGLPPDLRILFGQTSFIRQDLGSAGIDLTPGIKIFESHGVDQFYNVRGDAGPSGFFRLGKVGPVSFQPSDLGDLLYYDQGVIMASHHSKGEVLRRFLSLKGLDADMGCVFFADDEPLNIDAMKRSYMGTTGTRVFTYQVPKP